MGKEVGWVRGGWSNPSGPGPIGMLLTPPPGSRLDKLQLSLDNTTSVCVCVCMCKCVQG